MTHPPKDTRYPSHHCHRGYHRDYQVLLEDHHRPGSWFRSGNYWGEQPSPEKHPRRVQDLRARPQPPPA